VNALRRRGALLLLALPLLPGCKRDDDKKLPGEPPLPDSAVAITDSQRIAPPELGGACYSPPVRTVFHDKEAWNGWWTSENQNCPKPLVPQIDFQREMLIYAAMGKRMGSDDRISIEGTQVRHDSLIVYVHRYMLKEGCPAPPVESFPQSLVRVRVDVRPVRFSEAHVKIPCAG
jgi:hypothetical protein